MSKRKAGAIIYFEIGRHLKVFDLVDADTILHLNSGALTFISEDAKLVERKSETMEEGTERRRHTIRGNYHIVYLEEEALEE